jgi:hypothetical protein
MLARACGKPTERALIKCLGNEIKVLLIVEERRQIVVQVDPELSRGLLEA